MEKSAETMADPAAGDGGRKDHAVLLALNTAGSQLAIAVGEDISFFYFGCPSAFRCTLNIPTAGELKFISVVLEGVIHELGFQAMITQKFETKYAVADAAVISQHRDICLLVSDTKAGPIQVNLGQQGALDIFDLDG
ncbi:unnamed protein product [Gongylonema pulchrum]|uniref:MMS1_N domain-containing protein n=1 Tax=Gongylonema pulchrum TaxID=637853 RepID=A0A183EQ66_9BILA|nr:unnamed protein product [Gongylonema pulchrum]